ncbi:hypothetical protein DBR06_SOUSAS20810023, partial [Sousa chinensis]
VKYLGVLWSGKPKVVLSAVTGKMQAHLWPITPKQLQTWLGLLGCWRPLIPHLAQ